MRAHPASLILCIAAFSADEIPGIVSIARLATTFILLIDFAILVAWITLPTAIAPNSMPKLVGLYGLASLIFSPAVFAFCISSFLHGLYTFSTYSSSSLVADMLFCDIVVGFACIVFASTKFQLVLGC